MENLPLLLLLFLGFFCFAEFKSHAKDIPEDEGTKLTFSLCFWENGSWVLCVMCCYERKLKGEKRSEEGRTGLEVGFFILLCCFCLRNRREANGGRSIGFFWISHCLGSEKTMLSAT